MTANSTQQSNNTSITYTIGELAKEFDITTRSIRFYEDAELLNSYIEQVRQNPPWEHLDSNYFINKAPKGTRSI